MTEDLRHSYAEASALAALDASLPPEASTEEDL